MAKKTYPFLCLLIIALLTGCSSGNKFAASFGKRKYMKGYYIDKPSGTENVYVKEPAKGEIATNKPIIAAKHAIRAEQLTSPKALGIVKSNLLSALIKEPISKTVIQANPVERSVKAVNGDDYRRTNAVSHKRISGGLLFTIIFLAAIAILIILAVVIVNVSIAAKAGLLVLALVLLIVAIAMLITVAANSDIPGDVAGPVIEVLLDAFFAILGGLR